MQRSIILGFEFRLQYAGRKYSLSTYVTFHHFLTCINVHWQLSMSTYWLSYKFVESQKDLCNQQCSITINISIFFLRISKQHFLHRKRRHIIIIAYASNVKCEELCTTTTFILYTNSQTIFLLYTLMSPRALYSNNNLLKTFLLFYLKNIKWISGFDISCLHGHITSPLPILIHHWRKEIKAWCWWHQMIILYKIILQKLMLCTANMNNSNFFMLIF